ncbi:IS66 family transposase [Bacteriovoracaceae bacterium]|nr:IS66 family transposase [Bacteriovoracaceae bacterium]
MPKETNLNIESETNLDYLRELAKVLHGSNLLLQEKIKNLEQESFNHEQTRLILNDNLSILKNRFIFKGSEKLNPDRPVKDSSAGLLHNQIDDIESSDSFESNLDVQEIIHNIGDNRSPATCSCSSCENKLSPIKGQFEESVEIDVVERTYIEKRHKRQKYRCRACETIITANASKKLSKGSKYSIDFAINVAVDKFSYHLPLERQRRLMEEQGLRIGCKTLYNLTEKLYLQLSPIQDMIKKEILDSGYVHIDETGGKLLKTKTNGYIWAITNKMGAYFQYETTRSSRVAEEILKGYSGIIISDGFSGYKKYQKNNYKTRSANCWSHARRKFFDCVPQYPKAREFLELVSKLYKIEYEADNFEHLKELREKKSSKVIDEIRKWLDFESKKVMHRSKYYKAISYCHNLWEGLTLFLEDPYIPLDNNAVERILRSPVKGRDNYLGYQTINGADVAMFFYSIVESCKRLRINPRKYLREMMNTGKLITPIQYKKRV